MPVPDSVTPPSSPSPPEPPADAGSRRSFLLGLVACSAALGGLGAAAVRFLWRREPARRELRHVIGPPGSFPPAEVSERFRAAGFVVVHEGGIIYALSTTCTHLACQVNWLANQHKFKCPCHGSGYYVSGVNFEGPAPRPLERYGISLGADGQLVVDQGLVFRYERNEHLDPRSYYRSES